MDKSLCKEAADFFEKHPERLKEVEQWCKDNHLETLDEALKHASDSGYWVGCVYVAYQYYLLDGYIAITDGIKAGTFPPKMSPDERIIENALSEAKKAIREEDKISARLPVGDIAQKIYPILKALPEMKALTSEEIADELANLPEEIGPVVLDASTLRKRHFKQLLPYGLIKTEHGYCIR